MPITESEIERGVRYAGRHHPWSEDDEPDLTAIEGVGPKLAERLRSAGVNRPEDLQGRTQEELAAIEGIGRSKAARIRSQVEYGMPTGSRQTLVMGEGEEKEVRGFVHRESGQTEVTIGGETGVPDDELERYIDFTSGTHKIGTLPSTVGVSGRDKDEALEAHSDRSPESRLADESFNAPITLSYAQWASAPNRYDYPGVDTVPRSIRRKRTVERARRITERGGLREFVTTDSFTSGFNRGINRVSLGRSADPEGTLAHELGHAVEHQIDDFRTQDKPSHSLFEDEETLEQAEYLSERRRGQPIESTRRTYETNIFEDMESFGDIDSTYPFQEELFADVYAAMITEPRAARRDAPKAVREVESVLLGTGHYRR